MSLSLVPPSKFQRIKIILDQHRIFQHSHWIPCRYNMSFIFFIVMMKKGISELKKQLKTRYSISSLSFYTLFNKRINEVYLIQDIFIYFGINKKDQESVSAGLDPRV